MSTFDEANIETYICSDPITDDRRAFMLIEVMGAAAVENLSLQRTAV